MSPVAAGVDQGASPATPADEVDIFSNGPGRLEAGLMRRVANGEREALGELYDRYSGRLYSLAFSASGKWLDSLTALRRVLSAGW